MHLVEEIELVRDNRYLLMVLKYRISVYIESIKLFLVLQFQFNQKIKKTKQKSALHM